MSNMHQDRRDDLNDLATFTDNLLVSLLSQSLKDAIDDCLNKGGDPAEIWKRIDHASPEAPLTRRACEVFLERRLKGKG